MFYNECMSSNCHAEIEKQAWVMAAHHSSCFSWIPSNKTGSCFGIRRFGLLHCFVFLMIFSNLRNTSHGPDCFCKHSLRITQYG